MTTIYPDIEEIVIERLLDGIAVYDDPVCANVAVSVVKPEADEDPYPEYIVTVRSDGAYEAENRIIRVEGIGINVWAPNYRDANRLARIVEAIMCASLGGPIKAVTTTLSPTRVEEEDGSEHRYLTLDLTVKSSDQ